MILINGLEMKYLLGELEIRNWKRLELERSAAIKDENGKRYCLIAIAVLDGVLND